MSDEPLHPLVPLAPDPATGGVATIVQGTLPEVQQCAAAILRTGRGRRIEHLELGVSDPRWRAGVDLDEIGGALDAHEPRAEWEPIERDGLAVGVRITGAVDA